VERFTLAAFAQLHHLLSRPPINAEAQRRSDAEGEETLPSSAFPAFSGTPHKGIRRLTPRLQYEADSGRELASP